MRVVRSGPGRRAVLVPPHLGPMDTLPLALDLFPMEFFFSALDRPLCPLSLDVAHPLIAFSVKGLEFVLPGAHVPEVGRALSVPLRFLTLVGLLLAAPVAADGVLLLEGDVIRQEGDKAEVLRGEKSGKVDEREEDDCPGEAATDAVARSSRFPNTIQRGVLIASEPLSISKDAKST